jgi:ATP-dependent Lon protease
MEVLELSGYSEEEKIEIARRHLIPKQIRENGLEADFVTFTQDGIVSVVRDYTKEAGLRNLEREIGAICRKVARAFSEGRHERVNVDAAAVATYLGPPRFVSEIADRAHKPGVAIGLALDAARRRHPLHRSGLHEGNEGAHADGPARQRDEGIGAGRTDLPAQQRRRLQNRRCGVQRRRHPRARSRRRDPEGRPFRGHHDARCARFAFRGVPVRERVAMTGEITLRGAVLPVGGIKEKVWPRAAQGVREIYLPERNRKDVEEIDRVLRSSLQFHFVDEVDDVLRDVLTPVPVVAAVEPAAARAR